jgi:Fe-S-cluster-containing dehydrogenase component
MPRRFAMVIDRKLCVGCAACVVACMNQNESFGYSRCRVTERLTGSYPDLRLDIFSERCNHCADAPCVPVCPTGASHHSAHGLVEVNKDKCTGCRACVAACPYDARFPGSDGIAGKCDFCEPLVHRGLEPACVAQCPTQAMVFGDINDPQSELRRLLDSRKAQVLQPEAGTRPHIFYLEARP